MTTKTFVDSSDIPAQIRASQAAADKAAINKTTFNVLANAAGQTLTVAQMLQGILDRSGAVAVSDTTPTAAQLVAAANAASAAGAPVAVGDVILLDIRNRNTGVLTLAAGAGVTLEGTTTIPTVNTRRYAIRFLNVTSGAEAVTVSGLFQAAN